MEIHSLIYRLLGRGSKQQELAQSVVAACRQQAWQKVEGRVFTLNAGQARGYIRARAYALVADQIQQTVSWPPVRQHLFEMSLEMLVDDVIATRNRTLYAERQHRSAA